MKNLFRTILFTVTLTAVSAFRAYAQCPTLSVTGPDSEVTAGDGITFSANVVSGETKANVTNALTFNWSISAGVITSGQGTSAITVDTADIAGQSVTATLELGGLPPACSRSASATGWVKPSIVAIKLDEFGVTNEEDEWARLDAFAVGLQNVPDAVGYIIAYRGPKGPVGDAKAVNSRYLKYLVRMRGMNADKLKTIDGGIKQTPMREFWLVPMGATPPKATPMIVTPKAPMPKKPAPKKKP